jgi:hypothetical protein
MEFKRGQSFTAGPYTLKLDLVRPSVLTTPASQENGQVEAWLTITGPGEKIRSIEFLDQAGQPIVMARTDYGNSFERDQSTRRPYRLSSMPTGPVALRVRSYESTETVKVPFELNTGIGL